jgi:conjugal transfer pilus assembly protein TraV
MNYRHLIPCLLLPTLVGCAGSLSGLDGSKRLSCPVGEGVTCKPMSQVYEESAQPAEIDDAEGQTVEATPLPPRGAVETHTERVIEAVAVEATPLPPRGAVHVPPSAENVPIPLRTRPSVMRIWIAPWEDADGDLHEGAWIAMRLDDGRWNIDHVRERIREGYGAALVPPPAQESKPAAQAKPSSVAADVADVLPKNLLPSSKAPAEPFFDTNAD